MLGELRRDGLAELAAEAAREAHALALDVGAGLLEQSQRLRLLAELDADLLQHRLGIVLDEGEALFREQLVGRALPLDVAVLDRSEEQTSELQSPMRIPYAAFCWKEKTSTTHK